MPRTTSPWTIAYYLLKEPDAVQLSEGPFGLEANVPEPEPKREEVLALLQHGLPTNDELCAWRKWLRVKGGLALWKVPEDSWRRYPQGRCGRFLVRRLPKSTVAFAGRSLTDAPIQINEYGAKLDRDVTLLLTDRLPDLPFTVRYGTLGALRPVEDETEADNLWHNLKYTSKDLDRVVSDARNVEFLVRRAAKVEWGEGLQPLAQRPNLVALPTSVLLARANDTLRVEGYEPDLHYVYRLDLNRILPGLLVIGSDVTTDVTRPPKTLEDLALLVGSGFGHVLGEFSPTLSETYYV